MPHPTTPSQFDVPRGRDGAFVAIASQLAPSKPAQEKRTPQRKSATKKVRVVILVSEEQKAMYKRLGGYEWFRKEMDLMSHGPA